MHALLTTQELNCRNTQSCLGCCFHYPTAQDDFCHKCDDSTDILINCSKYLVSSEWLVTMTISSSSLYSLRPNSYTSWKGCLERLFLSRQISWKIILYKTRYLLVAFKLRSWIKHSSHTEKFSTIAWTLIGTTSLFGLLSVVVLVILLVTCCYYVRPRARGEQPAAVANGGNEQLGAQGQRQPPVADQ